MYRFVFTSGDINGIGPEIVYKTLAEAYANTDHSFVIPVAENIIKLILDSQEAAFPYEIIKNKSELTGNQNRVIFLDTGYAKFTPGIPTEESGEASFRSIKAGYELLAQGMAEALVTAPISKEAIIMAGYEYPGHTEMLQDFTGAKRCTMMFLSQAMKCGLVTIHMPLAKVSEFLNQKRILNTIETVHNALVEDLGMDNPTIAVLGLNPHAGENGHIGSEEEIHIKPLIENATQYNLEGPFPADAFFGNKLYREYDAFIAMYHDQGLIPFKMLNFSSGVNYTAGLPIVRTSPDHGTAYNIAWQNKADYLSFYQAFIWAETILAKRKVKHAG